MEVLNSTRSKRQFATEPGVPSIDILFFQSGSLPLTNHLLVISDVGSFMFLDCFSINSTDSASITGTAGVVTGVYPWNPAATAGAGPTTSSSSSTSQSSSHDTIAQQTADPNVPAASHSHHSEGAIIGGVIGGVGAALIAIVALYWLLRRRRQSRHPKANLGTYLTFASYPMRLLN